MQVEEEFGLFLRGLCESGARRQVLFEALRLSALQADRLGGLQVHCDEVSEGPGSGLGLGGFKEEDLGNEVAESLLLKLLNFSDAKTSLLEKLQQKLMAVLLIVDQQGLQLQKRLCDLELPSLGRLVRCSHSELARNRTTVLLPLSSQQGLPHVGCKVLIQVLLGLRGECRLLLSLLHCCLRSRHPLVRWEVGVVRS